MEKMLGRGEKMKVNYGSYIRKQAMKNLLSQYCPTVIDTIALIALTKYIMRISHKFDDEILDLGSDTEGHLICQEVDQMSREEVKENNTN